MLLQHSQAEHNMTKCFFLKGKESSAYSQALLFLLSYTLAANVASVFPLAAFVALEGRIEGLRLCFYSKKLQIHKLTFALNIRPNAASLVNRLAAAALCTFFRSDL